MIFPALAYVFLMQFSADFGIPVSTNIVFSSTTGQARCWHNSNLVEINLEHWNSLPVIHKKELVYHELGHCALDIRHDNSNPNIMQQFTYASKADGSNWPKLLEDLKMKHKMSRGN